MNQDTYADLIQDVRISSCKDYEFPIIGVFLNGKGFTVKQFEDDKNIEEVIRKFNSLV